MAPKKGNKHALGNKGGRPTKYKPELIEKIDEYLATCKDTYKQIVERYDNAGNKPISSKLMLDVKIPSKQGFAKFIKVNIDTINEWSKKYNEFSAALEKIVLEQHDKLLNNGLSGAYNPTIAKLGLMANHGYKEKVENDNINRNITIDDLAHDYERRVEGGA